MYADGENTQTQTNVWMSKTVRCDWWSACRNHANNSIVKWILHIFSTYRMYRYTYIGTHAVCTQAGIVKLHKRLPFECVCVSPNHHHAPSCWRGHTSAEIYSISYWLIRTHTALASFVFHFTNNNDTKGINQYLAMSIVCRFERINWLVWAFQISWENMFWACMCGSGYNLSYCVCL